MHYAQYAEGACGSLPRADGSMLGVAGCLSALRQEILQ